MGLWSHFSTSFEYVITSELFMQLKCKSIMNIMHFSVDEYCNTWLSLQFIFRWKCPHFCVVSDDNVLWSKFDSVAILIKNADLFRGVNPLILAPYVKPFLNPFEIWIAQLRTNFNSTLTQNNIIQIEFWISLTTKVISNVPWYIWNINCALGCLMWIMNV